MNAQILLAALQAIVDQEVGKDEYGYLDALAMQDVARSAIEEFHKLPEGMGLHPYEPLSQHTWPG